MRKYPVLIAVCVGLVGASWAGIRMKRAAAQIAPPTVFDSQGRLKLPTDYRKWVFVGAPLTPNALNGGDAAFPEYHHVYIEEKNVDAFLKTGSFPEGTVIIKELTRVLNPTFPDGSTTEPSGRGYFNGEFNGIDSSVKDSKRFAATNGWGFFTFGHHQEPYAPYAEEASAAQCASCHQANVAKTDMTWIQFYPMLLKKELKPAVSVGGS